MFTISNQGTSKSFGFANLACGKPKQLILADDIQDGFDMDEGKFMSIVGASTIGIQMKFMNDQMP